MNFGQRGIAILAPGCRLVTYIIFSFHPPYPVLVVAFAVTGFGNGTLTNPLCPCAIADYMTKRFGRCWLLCLVRQYGQRKPIAGLLAWLLLSRGYFRPDNCDINDREGRASLVCLL
jgi:hypothetical protein